MEGSSKASGGNTGSSQSHGKRRRSSSSDSSAQSLVVAPPAKKARPMSRETGERTPTAFPTEPTSAVGEETVGIELAKSENQSQNQAASASNEVAAGTELAVVAKPKNEKQDQNNDQ